MATFKDEFIKELVNRVGGNGQDAQVQNKPVSELVALAQKNYAQQNPSPVQQAVQNAMPTKKNSAVDRFNSFVVDHTVKGNSPLPDSMITPQSPKHDPRSDYEDARRKLWEYQTSEEGRQSAQKDNAYRQAVQERSTGDQLPYKDETLDRLRNDVSATKAAYEAEENKQHDQAVYDQDMAEISGLSPEELEQLQAYSDVRGQGKTGNLLTDMFYLPAQKKKAAGGLLDKYGEQRLNELAETYSRSVAQQQKEQVEQAAQRDSDGIWGGALSTVTGVAASPVSAFMGAKGRMDEWGNSSGRYNTLQSFTPGDTFNVYTDAAKQNVTQQIAGDGNSMIRKGLSLFYQAGTGAAQSAFNAIVLGPAAGAAVSATGQFTRTLSEATQRGATQEQAYLLATSSAAIDYAMDKIPLDRLFSLAKSGSPAAIQAAFKQAGIEMLTEGASFVGAQLLDMAVLQENSEYAQSIQQQVENGVPLDEATRQANKELLSQAEQTMLVAGISGGISAGVSTAIGNHRAKKAPQEVAPDPTVTPQDTAPQQDPTRPTPQEPATPPQGAAPDAPIETPTQPQTPPQEAPRPDTTPAQTEQVDPRLEQIRQLQQQRDLQAQAEKISYDDQKAQDKYRKELQKDIDKTQKDVDSGKGSPARLAMLQEKMNQLDMQQSDYPRTRQDAIAQQIDIVNALSGEQHTAYIRRETGEATNRPNKTATTRLKAAKAELDRLRGMSDADYQAELSSMGLPGIPNWLDTATENLAAQGRRNGTEQERLVQSVVDQIRAKSEPAPIQQNEKVPDLAGATDFLATRLADAQEQYAQKNNTGKKTKNSKIPAQETAADNIQQQRPTPQQTVSNMVSEATANRVAQQQAARRTVQDTAAGLVSNPNLSDAAADQNFTGTARYQDLLSDDNVKPSRASDFRSDKVPEMDGAKRVSDVAKNLMGSKNTTDAAADQVKQLIDSGVFSYDPKTNRQSLQEAAADLDARGADTIRKEIDTHLKNGFVADGDIEKAVTLVNQYIQSGDEKAAAEMMGDLSLLAQKSGRNLQMFSLIRRMTPEGQLDTLQQAADRFLSKGKPNQAPAASGTKKGSSAPEPTRANIPVELKNQYIEAARSKDPQRIQEATQAIAMEVGSQYQATFGEKWDTWRYMCMLGNATTNERNIAGNAMFKPYVAVKEKLAAIFEQTLAKDKRTKAFFTDKDLLAWAKEDVKSVEAQNALKYSAKLGDDVTTDIFSENKRIFKSNAMETARKFIEWAPSAGDMFFKNGYYSKYLANFLTARGVSAADVRAGNVDPDLMAQARQYAVDNAYINTFNDSNQFSEFMSSAGKLKNSNNAAARVFGRVVDAVLPFRKTPANILVRFKEYSPAEFLEVAFKMTGKGVDKISKGKHGWSRGYTASQFCNDLASGLTGTLAVGAGYAFANGIFDSNGNGVRLVAKATDEEKLQDIQDYSIVLTYDGKTTSHSIEWAAPANLPLFVGANLYAAYQESQQQEAVGVDKFLNFLEAGTSTLEPLLDLACLSSINDLLQDVKYSEDKAIWKIAASTAVSYVSQAIPSLLRQTNTFRQTEKQTTFANHHNKMGREIQRTASNIPFVGEALGLKTDKIGVWGEKEDQGSLGKRAFNAYLNPVKTTEVKTDATTAEISRLAKTEYGTGVVPEVAPKTLTYEDKNGETHKDVRLTAQQWESYATTRGKTSKKVLDRMIQSKDYRELTDSGKAAAIDLVYQYADKTGAIAAMKDHDGYPETWMKEASEAASPAQYILQKVSNRQMNNSMGNLTNAWSHGQDRPASKAQLEAAYDSYAASSETLKEAVKKAAEGAVSKYLEARDDNVSSDVALSIIRQVQSIPQKDRGKAHYQYQAISKTPGLSDAQLDQAMKLYMPDYDKEEKKPVKTEPRYDYIRQQLGFSPQEYAAAAYAMRSEEADTDESGSVTKNEAVQAIMDLGYDRQTATSFWAIYSGSGGNAYKNALNRFIAENY